MTAPARKIWFRIVQDEDGFPGFGTESMWAQPGLRPGEYVVDNIPFFTSEATLGDTIEVREEDGLPWFSSIVSQSRNSLLRVVFFRPCVDAVNATLVSLGCGTELMTKPQILSVSVPETANLEAVQAYLRSEAAAGNVDYEEAILWATHERPRS
jgi:hypothetical protein